jgi:hypothetical protein
MSSPKLWIRFASTTNLQHNHVAMALARLLGFDLCPRLKALKDRHLFLPRGAVIPQRIRSICHANVDLAKILAHWDEIVHLVASVHGGHTSAVMRSRGSARPHAAIRSMKRSSISVGCCALCSSLECAALERRAAGTHRTHRADPYRGHQLARRVPLPDRAICRTTGAVIAGGEISRRWPLRRPDTPGKYHLCRGTGTPCKSSPWRNRPSNHAGKQRPPAHTFGTEIKGTPKSQSCRRSVTNASWRIGPSLRGLSVQFFYEPASDPLFSVACRSCTRGIGPLTVNCRFFSKYSPSAR